MEQVKQMSPVNGDRALVFTVRDLDHRTGQVMDEIEKYQRPAVITRHGRFIATIKPLAPGQVESPVLGAI
jgi:antitoxin (DNA-binding transcriptional repressor) of toxin-antitoxin stability system